MGNYMGLMPGLMAPTSNINVTLGCALTIWVYYHFQGIREQGVVGVHQALRRAARARRCGSRRSCFPIEIISHLSRVLSLSLRLFGNIFGEELVIMILFSIVPFLVPLPMMFLGLVTGGAAGVHLRAAVDHLPGGGRRRGAPRGEHGHDAPAGSTRRRRPEGGGTRQATFGN